MHQGDALRTLSNPQKGLILSPLLGHIPVGLKIGVPFQVVVSEPKVSVLRDGLVKWGVRVLPGVPQHWALLWEGRCGQCC